MGGQDREHDAGASYRYQAMTRELIARIEAGHYAEGERLPSVRALMRAHQVSMTTASRVLVELESQGYAFSRERSGFFVQPRPPRTGTTPTTPTPTRTARPAVVSMNALVASLFRAQAGEGQLSLGAAELAAELLPTRALTQAMIKVARASGAEGILYGPAGGEPALRHQIARWMGTRGVVVAPEEVWITEGESGAMGAALRALTRPGDLVAVESPTYFGLLRWIEALGLQAVEIATDPRLGVDVEELERVLETLPVAVIAVNPVFHNPFGGTVPPERMQALIRLAARHRVPVIEDDVYGALSFDSHGVAPLRAHDEAGGVLYCSSFSKTVAPGYRVGWCLPGRWAERLALFPFGGAVLPQRALAVFLAGRAHARHLEGLRALFAGQASRIRALVLEAFPEGTRISDPRGGYVFWVEGPASFDALGFHARARAHGIGIAPGPLFSPTGRFANAFRLSVGRPLTPGVEEAIRTLGRLARGGD
ncbi:aminotransferase-like domain-containing protein [Pararhodospirillum oryzae]|uniref:GntR family transcriptional regulator n=1 Tax=Pararhodospirillum oryzae TaxID=478448 RepID=A0A512H5A5_9PROT|nr:PLP-dependent aminotransferase family protein [Pararhodospirillum oryzae]GEO80655.1 GntR family transcriptional regulator [Pararhodospirillum oryzae]